MSARPPGRCAVSDLGRSRARRLDIGTVEPIMAELTVPDIPITPHVDLDPQTTALVVVDMQNDFVSDGGALQVPDAQATVPAIADLLRRFRAASARVVF